MRILRSAFRFCVVCPPLNQRLTRRFDVPEADCHVVATAGDHIASVRAADDLSNRVTDEEKKEEESDTIPRKQNFSTTVLTCVLV